MASCESIASLLGSDGLILSSAHDNRAVAYKDPFTGQINWPWMDWETYLHSMFTDCKGINVEQIYTTLYGCTKKLIQDREKLENQNEILNTKIDEMEEVITDLYEQVDNLNNSVNELKELINQYINK